MLISNQLIAFYNGILTAAIVCYIMYRLNMDDRIPRVSEFCISGLIIALFTSQLPFYVPIMNDLIIKVLGNLLIVIFVLVVFFKYTLYQSFLATFFGNLILGVGDFFLTFIYVFPLGLSGQDYATSLIHITAGSIIVFLFVFGALYFFAGPYMKVRRRIYGSHKKLAMLLSANLTALFLIFLVIYNLFRYFYSFRVGNTSNNLEFYIGATIGVVSVVSITLAIFYLINYLVFNELKYDRMQRSYTRDALTGALNRASGMGFLQEKLELCKSTNDSLAVCYIDINDLKVVNDSFGHKEGDKLIITIIDIIKKNIRGTDVIARFGGDEFIVIFPGRDMEHGRKIMSKVAQELKNIKLFEGFEIRFSYGFSEYNGYTPVMAEELLEIADREMYSYKRAIKAMA